MNLPVLDEPARARFGFIEQEYMEKHGA